ncbi:hypothetical protein RvY_11772 [Ramazzottius varieornatus]|uniref:Uncharacterized protein n=1 Tax=Ramazzottius varieornatus TaxID=947166 RepID=A0A1D1VH68_RAMVA|nr:hypothetical protein RvY_11772 [Ramazzottius varieornatus]
MALSKWIAVIDVLRNEKFGMARPMVNGMGSGPTEIFPYETEEEYNATMTFIRHKGHPLQILEKDTFAYSEKELASGQALPMGGLNNTELNPATAHFAIRNARPLTEDQLANLAELLGQVDPTHHNYVLLAEKLIEK